MSPSASFRKLVSRFTLGRGDSPYSTPRSPSPASDDGTVVFSDPAGAVDGDNDELGCDHLFEQDACSPAIQSPVASPTKIAFHSGVNVQSTTPVAALVPMSNSASKLSRRALSAFLAKQASPKTRAGERDRVLNKLQTALDELKSHGDELNTRIGLLNHIVKKERKKCSDYKARFKALRDALECPICASTIKDPYTLSCGHVACAMCIQCWFISCEAPVLSRPDLLRVNSCPLCRCHVEKPAPSYLLKTVLEHATGRPGSSSSSTASMTRAPGSPHAGQILWRGVFESDLDTCISCGGLGKDGICIGYKGVYDA